MAGWLLTEPGRSVGFSQGAQLGCSREVASKRCMYLPVLHMCACADTEIPRHAYRAGKEPALQSTEGLLPRQGDSVSLLRPSADWMRPTQTIKSPLLYLKSADLGCHCVYRILPCIPRLALMMLGLQPGLGTHKLTITPIPVKVGETSQKFSTPLISPCLHQPHWRLVVTLLPSSLGHFPRGWRSVLRAGLA